MNRILRYLLLLLLPLGGMADVADVSSTAYASLNTANLIIRDAQAQEALTGQPVAAILTEANRGIYTDTGAENSGATPAALKGENALGQLQQEAQAAEYIDQNRQSIKQQLRETQNTLQEAYASGQISAADYAAQQSELSRQQQLTDALANILLADNAGEAALGAYMPYAAAQIKAHTASGSAGNLVLHSLLGAGNALANGGNSEAALRGALAAGGAEAAIPLLAQTLYGTSDAEQLSGAQKGNLSILAGLLGAGIGGSGGDASGIVSGSRAAENAVDNNGLMPRNIEQYADPAYQESLARIRKNVHIVDAEVFNEAFANCQNKACEDRVWQESVIALQKQEAEILQAVKNGTLTFEDIIAYQTGFGGATSHALDKMGHNIYLNKEGLRWNSIFINNPTIQEAESIALWKKYENLGYSGQELEEQISKHLWTQSIFSISYLPQRSGVTTANRISIQRPIVTDDMAVQPGRSFHLDLNIGRNNPNYNQALNEAKTNRTYIPHRSQPPLNNYNSKQYSGPFPLEGQKSHTILYRTDNQGKITSYAVYDIDGIIIKRVDMQGKSHADISTPHVIEYGRNVLPDGTVKPQKPPKNQVRKARPDELQYFKPWE